MVFSSPIFLFCFLPILILVYFGTPRQFKNCLLLLASLLFYAWGEGTYVALMLLSIGLNYCFGRIIDSSAKSKIFLCLGVSLNLLLLISYKYFNFISDNFNSVLASLNVPQFDLVPVHLPLGISFFTFQAISYLVDIYRKEIPSQKKLIDLGLYIALFPQLIAGPIVRYKTIISDIDNRKHSTAMFAQGAERFTHGLAKKMLIANPLGYIADLVFDLPVSETATHIVWFGLICYALQIYFDFSGYSDMAIGLGRMFGFRFLENFNYPYAAQSLQEFWRKWHISLSSWFKDYLYIPLGGNRLSGPRTYLNLFAVFLLCGLWHGASWNFLVWGALHGLVLTIERLGLASFIETLWRPLRHCYLLLIVLLTWVFFRAETLSDSIEYIVVMFSFNFESTPFEVVEAINTEVILAGLFGLVLSAPLYRSMLLNSIGASAPVKSSEMLSSSLTPLRTTLMIGLLFLSTVKLASSTHNPFIYFRF